MLFCGWMNTKVVPAVVGQHFPWFHQMMDPMTITLVYEYLHLIYYNAINNYEKMYKTSISLQNLT